MKKSIRIICLIIGLIFIFPNASIASVLENKEVCVDGDCLGNVTAAAFSKYGDFVLVYDSVKGAVWRLDYDGEALNPSKKFSVSTRGDNCKLSLSVDNNNLLISSEGSPKIEVLNINSGISYSLSDDLAKNIVPNTVSFIGGSSESIVFVSNISDEAQVISTFSLKESKVIDSVPLPGIVREANVSKDLRSVIISFKGLLAQSVGHYDSVLNRLTLYNVNNNLFFSVDDLELKNKFNLFGSRSILSSFDGLHVLHVLDLDSFKLYSNLLSSDDIGESYSDISQDGKIAVVAGNLVNSGYTLSRVNLNSVSKPKLSKSTTITKKTWVKDLIITPDQRKAIVLQNDNLLKIFNLKDLSLDEKFQLSLSDNDQIFIDPFGRYVLQGDSEGKSNIQLVKDIEVGPVLKNITLDASDSDRFVINGFIDLENIFSNIRVCFKTSSKCSSSAKLSDDGLTITGVLPEKLIDGDDVIIIGRSKKDNDFIIGKYEGIFKSSNPLITEDDLRPTIDIRRPKKTVSKKKTIRVKGFVNGTGSGIASIKINGSNISKIRRTEDPNLFSFRAKITFPESGSYDLLFEVTDDFGNKAERTITYTVK